MVRTALLLPAFLARPLCLPDLLGIAAARLPYPLADRLAAAARLLGLLVIDLVSLVPPLPRLVSYPANPVAADRPDSALLCPRPLPRPDSGRLAVLQTREVLPPSTRRDASRRLHGYFARCVPDLRLTLLPRHSDRWPIATALRSLLVLRSSDLDGRACCQGYSRPWNEAIRHLRE